MYQKSKEPFHKDILKLKDVDKVCDGIIEKMTQDVRNVLQRRGGIVGISGGIDSSVTFALAAKAFGPENLRGILLPEKDSNDDSKEFAIELANKFGVEYIIENISHALRGFGCYDRRDSAIKSVIPHFDPKKDKSKIEIKQDIDKNMPSLFYITVIKENGDIISKLLPPKEYLQIVAASNFKQRSRMSMLYYHAERLHYAVIGTPNKHEVKQGFFVKHGDGGADLMPIGHLYKTQVYQLAKFLEVPQTIIQRVPTTDTYTAEQTQEDFFYQMPFAEMDLIWYGWENGYPVKEIAEVMDRTEESIMNIFKNFERKIKTTDYLRRAPIF
jgi:NAD+ synthase